MGGGVQFVRLLVEGAPIGAAEGEMPIEAPAGKIMGVVGVKPSSSARKWLVPRLGEFGLLMAKYSGSVALVTTRGAMTSKMACLWDENGDVPNTTAQPKPMSAA